ncbi:beta-L-arabinofuranosidase domain-containing protein [Changpingibacter yushuensis]|uniref:beta-L-arabinofuranosidase domain-containing protein n=1 Tax=Changpingibacter yushuensis TaxID=2758440 RepID=UPI001FE7DAD1|nr:beta-L-arabinofuranosidase domain-containing protein [Changpingibacter yushuensis]
MLSSVSGIEFSGESVYDRPRSRMLELAHAYPVDRLLAVFRRNAGLDEHGALPPGGWENFGHPLEQPWNEFDYPGREMAHTANLLRGHYAGHFLSMLSIAAEDTGDPELRGKVDEFVAGLAQVQEALAHSGRFSHPGFLAAYGEWQFSQLENYAPYGEIWAPYYTAHKIMAGLLDAYERVGNTQALRVLTLMGYWVHSRLTKLPAGQRQKMWSLYIAGEYGGMNETLTRLAEVARVPLFHQTASFFEQPNLLETAQTHQDALTGMHANQHLPQMLGYVRQYEATGERSYLEAVLALWDQIVPGRTFAHGGTGSAELWGAPNAVIGSIGRENAETCATYNLIKIANRLFLHTQDSAFAHYVERARLNHIVGSRRNVSSLTSPEVTYMFPVHPGALREYDNVGTCCGGTGLENHVSYGEGMVFEECGGLWLNQYAPMRFRWAEAGATLAVETQYPLGSTVCIRFSHTTVSREMALHVRIPSWLNDSVAVLVNGEEVCMAKPGSFARVTRTWVQGDVVVMEFPLTLRMEPALDDPSAQALFFGPTLLLARSESTRWITAPQLESQSIDGVIAGCAPEQIAESLRTNGSVQLFGQVWEPCWSGGDSRYHMYLRAANTATDAAGNVEPPQRVVLPAQAAADIDSAATP